MKQKPLALKMSCNNLIQQPIDATRVHMNSNYGWINITASNMWAPIHPQSDLISENH